MTYLGTWTYEKHPKTSKLIRIRKTTVRYSPPPDASQPIRARVVPPTPPMERSINGSVRDDRGGSRRPGAPCLFGTGSGQTLK
jgi:hypothetical protein